MLVRHLLGLGVVAVSALAQTKPLTKLGPVTWNPWNHTLQWTTEEGNFTDKGEWRKTGQTDYSIDFREQLMYKNGKQPLSFTPAEAARMDELFNKLATEYAVDSVRWYESGGKIEQQPVPAPAGARKTQLIASPLRSEPPPGKPGSAGEAVRPGPAVETASR